MVFFFATGIMKQSDAYKIALARAQTNSAVIEAIGSPISQIGIVSGNSNVNGPAGEVSLSIPLSGPKGKATLYVEAKKSADLWMFQTMVVKIEKTGERIDLNKPAPAPEKRISVASLNCKHKSSRGVAFSRRAPSGERTRPRVLIAAPRRNALRQQKFCDGEAPSPAREARALPRFARPPLHCFNTLNARPSEHLSSTFAVSIAQR